MAIQDDFSIDFPARRITYSTAFVDDRPPTIYTVNELYSYLQDTFDEPGNMRYRVPMSAQTPTQYTLINGWFMDDESMKALYGGSIQTSGWSKSANDGVTQLRYQNAPADPPVAGDIGVALTGGTSGATGDVIAVDLTRQIIWVRNTSVAQFSNNENVTGTGIDVQTETINGVKSGESVWANVFSVGSLQTGTEVYVGQEDDRQGGRSYHTANTEQTRIEKLDEWWDSDVDFTASPNLLGGAGHIDLLVKTFEAGSAINGQRLAVFARQFSKVYSHFELVGGVGNFVVPFSSTGADLNSQFGPYTANFDGRTGNDLEIGDILENNAGTTPVGRLRAVVTAVTGGASATGSFEYYLIGENEPLTTTDRTLRQFLNDEFVKVRDDTTAFQINGAPAEVTDGPAQSQGITLTFGAVQADVNEDSINEEYAATLDCNNVPLAEVYRYLMFLASRGNQDGTTPDTQDTLLPTAVTGVDEATEFYRAVGDFIIFYDGGIGTQLTEGDYVENSGATASGVVVSGGTVAMGTTGVIVLTQVKGTFADNDQVARPGEHVTNRVDVAGTPSPIADNTAAPFGTFAGGRFFFAQGIYPINVPAADANNWQAIDLNGVTRIPPTVRTITFAGLVANDRAFLAEVDTAGGADITVNQNGVGPAGAIVGATSIPLDATVDLDVPAENSWIRVVDSSSTTGEEYRLFYTAVSGTTVTLDSAAGLSGTTDGVGSSTVLVDSGAFATFEATGSVRTGMEIRNVTDGSRAVVLRKIDNDQIETTPLTGGTDDTWQSGDSWEANTVPVALVDADTVYFPFIDGVATGTTLTALVKYVADTPLIARARFSDPDVGGTRILPFEQRSITLTDANLTVTAIRTEDPIAS